MSGREACQLTPWNSQFLSHRNTRIQCSQLITMTTLVYTCFFLLWYHASAFCKSNLFLLPVIEWKKQRQISKIYIRIYIHKCNLSFLIQRQFRLVFKLARRASHKEGRVYCGNIGIYPAWEYTTLRWSVTGTWIAMQQTRTVVQYRCSSRPHLSDDLLLWPLWMRKSVKPWGEC